MPPGPGRIGRAALCVVAAGAVTIGTRETTGLDMDWWIWVIGGLALLSLELVSPGVFYLFFFGCGALAVGLLAALGWTEPLWLQGVFFTFLSLFSVLFLRPRIMKKMQTDSGDPKIDSLVGERALVQDEIVPNGWGKAELRGATWKARNAGTASVGPGQSCLVEKVDGLTLWVRGD